MVNNFEFQTLLSLLDTCDRLEEKQTLWRAKFDIFKERLQKTQAIWDVGPS